MVNFIVESLNICFIDNPCKLYCKPKHHRFFKYFNEIVEDGTPCSTSSNDVCIYGACKVINLVYNIKCYIF